MKPSRPACPASKPRIAVFLALGAGVYPSLALSTKPCPPSPCESSGGAVDVKRCQALAAWVAVGTISNVVHHEQGPPLSKDFAEFTFTVLAWEKGSGKVGQQVRFHVGWCENTQALPTDTSGSFRFFGRTLPTDPALPNQFLYFEAVRSPRPGVPP